MVGTDETDAERRAALRSGARSWAGSLPHVLILGMTAKGLRLLGVHTTQQLVITGLVMLLAVYLHGARQRLLAESRTWEEGS